MLDGFKQYLFLVVDQETKGILTKCSSMNTANAVSKGILNSSPMLVPYPFMSLKHEIINYRNNVSINYKLIKNINYPLSIMDSEINVYDTVVNPISKTMFDLIKIDNSDDWTKKRSLANFRSEKMEILENICERYISRVKNFPGDDLFFHYIGLELSKEKSNSIKEWAEMNEITEDAARQELTMMYDSTGIILIRIQAVWNRYVNIINNMSDFKTFEENQIISKIESELKFGKK